MTALAPALSVLLLDFGRFFAETIGAFLAAGAFAVDF
jgi:hypothetical protein